MPKYLNLIKLFHKQFVLVFFLGSSMVSLGQKAKVDSILILLEKSHSAKEECDLHAKLSLSYRIVDPEKGVEYGKRAKKEAFDLNWKEGKMNAMFALAANLQLSAEYPKSLENYFGALKIAEELKDKVMQSKSLSGISIVYRKTANYQKCIQYANRSLALNQKLNREEAKIENYNELAIANAELGNSDKAIENFEYAMEISKSMNNLRYAAILIGNIGNVQQNAKRWKDAITSHKEAATMHRMIKFEMGEGLCYQNIGSTYLDYHKDSVYSAKLGVSLSASLDSALFYLNKSFAPFEKYAELSSIALSHRLVSETYILKNDFKNALENFKQHQAIKDSIDSNDDKVKVAKLGEERAELEKFQQMKITKQQTKLRQLTEAKRRNETIGFVVGIMILLTFTVFIFRERRKSERLLLNILPQSVAAELKKKGSSQAQHFNDVTVLFTDFVGFTKVSERLTPQELVHELDTCFRVFDQIMVRYNIEKIKTIGDAYMAVSGLPEKDPNHAQNIINAAQDIVKFMKERKRIVGENTFEIRVGVHTGNVVAGIVGVKKFAYDIWGDTVNTAARMEQNGKPGRINVSASTYQLIKDDFTCEYRGELEAKNKGKLSMYFVAEVEG